VERASIIPHVQRDRKSRCGNAGLSPHYHVLTANHPDDSVVASLRRGESQ
jgi:hypothetical protein